MQNLSTRQLAAPTIADSPLVFAVRSLLFPLITIFTLVCCLAAFDEPFKGVYLLIAVLTFLGVPECLGIAQIGPQHHVHRRCVAILNLTARWIVVVCFTAIVAYLAGLLPAFNVRIMLTWVIVTPIALYVGQFGACYLLTRAKSGAGSMRRAVIIGATELGARVERALHNDPLLRTSVVGYFEDRARDRIAAKVVTPILADTRGLASYVSQHNIEQVYITLPMNRSERMLALLESLQDSTASIYFVPDLFAFNLIQARFDSLNGIPILAVTETPFFGGSWVLKRCSDIAIAFAAITLAFPFLLAVAAAIRLESSGPIIFRQLRYGLDGREILVYKFRSMRVTEDGKSTFRAANRSDSRVTKVGSFIRKTSLDEMPQLINVLQGNMSIIGPRPHPVAMNEHYRRAIPSYMVRHKVKPGITGWAQVNGYRGGDDLESMRKRIEYDLAYLRNWSLWLDLRILMRTVMVMWKDRSAY